jgi:hypothetical protein
MEKERLQFCIERWDHFYDSINNKSTVFLGLSTFIVGGLVASYPSILEKVHSSLWIHFLMLALIGLGVTIMIIVIKASTPFLSKKEKSLFYFGAVACLTEDDFYSKSSCSTAEDDLKDLRKQAFQLSQGLNKKFSRLKTAGILFTIQFYLFIPLILIIICNIK